MDLNNLSLKQTEDFVLVKKMCSVDGKYCGEWEGG